MQDPATRAFLLQNLRFEGEAPAWRCGLDEIAAALADIEGFPDFASRYEGPGRPAAALAAGPLTAPS